MPEDPAGEADFDVLIRTLLSDPIAIELAQSLFEEAGIPFFVMDANTAARQESGNLFGWWSVRVPKDREAEAREILESIEKRSDVRARGGCVDGRSFAMKKATFSELLGSVREAGAVLRGERPPVRCTVIHPPGIRGTDGRQRQDPTELGAERRRPTGPAAALRAIHQRPQ